MWRRAGAGVTVVGRSRTLYGILSWERCTLRRPSGHVWPCAPMGFGLFWRWFGRCMARAQYRDTDERSQIGNCEAAESGFGWSSRDPPPWRGDWGALDAVLILKRCTLPGPSATCLSAWVGGGLNRRLCCRSHSHRHIPRRSGRLSRHHHRLSRRLCCRSHSHRHPSRRSGRLGVARWGGARRYDRHDSRCVSRTDRKRWPSDGGNDTDVSPVWLCSMSICVGACAT